MGLIVTKTRGGAVRIIKEPVTEIADGIRTAFTTQTGKYYPSTLSVYFNGVRERYAVETGGQGFTLTPAPRVGSKLDVEYVLY